MQFKNLKVLKVSKNELAIQHSATMEVHETINYGWFFMKSRVEKTTYRINRFCLGKVWFLDGEHRPLPEEKMRRLVLEWELEHNKDFEDLRNGDGSWD